MAASAPTTAKRADQLALAAALTTIVFWASAFVGIRAAAADFSPGALALGRLIVGAIALGLIVAWRRPRLPTRRQLPSILVIGVLWFGIYFLALNAAEREVDAGTASLLVNVAPIIVAIFGGLFLGEGFPPRLLIGCVIALAGVALISVATSGAGSGGATTVGILLCFVSALAYSIAATVQKPLLRTLPGLTVTWLGCTIGAIVCLPFLPQLLTEAPVASGSGLGWLVFLGIFPTAIAFTTWAFAMGRSSVGRLGSLTYLVPAIAIAIGWLLLAEVPQPLSFVGGAIAIAGVIVARSAPARPAAPTVVAGAEAA
ncbi:MAG TPA: DMT family transporter [Candidatus Limnocylindria bacterium]|nr:DMT family transporter [Candidatus Limnocylindria bacterium]